jgi:peptide/nickel transport system substrate-binding protein
VAGTGPAMTALENVSIADAGACDMRHVGKLAALYALLLPVVCSLPAQARDELIIGAVQFPPSLHPQADGTLIRSYALGFALRPITAYDKDWQKVCLVCTELPTLENGLARYEDHPDGGHGLAVTIRLRPDLKWGDGEPVTARDLAFTWRVGRDPASGFTNSHPWNRATAIDVVDAHTAVLHLEKAVVSYNEWDGILPEHIEGPVYDSAREPGEYMRRTTYNRAPTTPGLYNGPYLITDYRSGSEIDFAPNPHWAGVQPGFKRIRLRMIENTAALQANLLSGDIDMPVGENVGLTIDQALALEQQRPDAFTYIFKPGLTYEHVVLRLDNPALADLRVRRALLLSLDRKTLVAKLFQGRQPVADSWVAPLDPNHAEDTPHYAYDPAAARHLLDEAGWKPGSDGIRRNAAGERLSLEFGTTAGNHLRELQQQVMQSQWKAVGVETVIKNQAARTLFGETIRNRLFTGLEMYGYTSGVGELPERQLSSALIPSAANNYSGGNSSGFSDPAMDADLAAAKMELDPVKRKVIWADMQRIYAENLPALPLFFRAEPHVIPKWLRGYEPTGHENYSSFWSENWRSD